MLIIEKWIHSPSMLKTIQLINNKYNLEYHTQKYYCPKIQNPTFFNKNSIIVLI